MEENKKMSSKMGNNMLMYGLTAGVLLTSVLSAVNIAVTATQTGSTTTTNADGEFNANSIFTNFMLPSISEATNLTSNVAIASDKIGEASTKKELTKANAKLVKGTDVTTAKDKYFLTPFKLSDYSETLKSKAFETVLPDYKGDLKTELSEELWKNTKSSSLSFSGTFTDIPANSTDGDTKISFFTLGGKVMKMATTTTNPEITFASGAASSGSNSVDMMIEYNDSGAKPVLKYFGHNNTTSITAVAASAITGNIGAAASTTVTASLDWNAFASNFGNDLDLDGAFGAEANSDNIRSELSWSDSDEIHKITLDMHQIDITGANTTGASDDESGFANPTTTKAYISAVESYAAANDDSTNVGGIAMLAANVSFVTSASYELVLNKTKNEIVILIDETGDATDAISGFWNELNIKGFDIKIVKSSS